jgi:glycine/D-amino acid oxidase-like deaminating enzyme
VRAIVPIEQACYWLARRPPREAVRLEGAQAADVVIVGAGLTGLWTAIFLRELDPGLAVAVIERGLAAHGANGRNAGIVSETVPAIWRRLGSGAASWPIWRWTAPASCSISRWCGDRRSPTLPSRCADWRWAR